MSPAARPSDEVGGRLAGILDTTPEVRGMVDVVLAMVWCLLAGVEPTAHDLVASLSARSLKYREERDQVRAELANPKTPFAALAQVLTCDRVELRRVAAEALERRQDPDVGPQILTMLGRESDSATTFKLALSLAERADVTPSSFRQLLATAPSDKRLKAAYEQYLRAKIQLAMDSLVHEGQLAGFYSGQFQPLYAVTDDMADRLALMANDSRLHHFVRTISIMALNESGDERLPSRLAPLLRDAEMEAQVEIDPTWSLNLELTEAQQLFLQEMMISKYARFALAKAGFPETIREKLQVLNRYLENLIHRKDLDPLGKLLAIPKDQLLFLIDTKTDAQPPEVRPDRWLPIERADAYRLRSSLLERLQHWDELVVPNLLFEIAYHHQQLKRYDDCIRRYQLIVFLFGGGEPRANSTAISAHYNLACIYALQGDKVKALDELEAAIKIGFYDFAWAQEDRDLASLRDEPRFKAMFSLQTVAPAAEPLPVRVPGGKR